MPECSNMYEMFYREYYWSPAYKYYDSEELTKREICDKGTDCFIANVEVTTINYIWEAEEDHSKDTTLSFLMPSQLLFNGMKMQYADKEGVFLDEVGNVICFDACSVEKNTNYLLIRKDSLMEYLKTHHKRIIWYVLGEKKIIGLHNYRSIPDLPMWLVISGTYTLDETGKVTGRLRTSHERG
mgnify:FL=1